MPDERDGEAETVEVMGADDLPGARWQPVQGSETRALLAEVRGLKQDEKARVCHEAVSILSSCVPPKAPDERETGLVFGHVQSGKTMSFTTAAALARDNGYALVIVITGSSVPLSDQSIDRLKADLGLDTRAARRWRHIKNPGRGDGQAIAGSLEDWRDQEVPAAVRQTVLLTVLKNHNRLSSLISILRELDLKALPVLVIDDEADQASLNNLVRQQRQSTTYRKLRELRDALPHHTYLQYTATPQAPLLINLIDALSPRFAAVLTPGADYVGGREFFKSHQDLVRVIPPTDLVTRNSTRADPPESLVEAMRVFLLGVAAGYIKDNADGNRSMLVHPSQHRDLHTSYATWVDAIKKEWETLLRLPDTDSDFRDFMEELRHAYRDLQGTVSDIPSFDALVKVLRRATRLTLPKTVNAAGGKTPAVDWDNTYAHILVGGQAMDRGFTVRGLTVTYMPRPVGMGNADTVQQRARFFGYKRDYLGYCRIWLQAGARAAYERYVEHEEDLRERLEEHRRSGKPLLDWKRAFLLHPSLQPTRQSVLDLYYLQGFLSDQWFDPAAPHDSADAVEMNRAVFGDFLSSLDLRPDETSRHNMTDGVRLALAYERLLTRVCMTASLDSQRYTGLLLQMKVYLDEHPDAGCRIYQMSQGGLRERALGASGAVDQLFQGPSGPYPGDRALKAKEGVTIQLHTLNLTKDHQVVHQNVPAVAVWVPAEMGRGWLVQDPS